MLGMAELIMAVAEPYNDFSGSAIRFHDKHFAASVASKLNVCRTHFLEDRGLHVGGDAQNDRGWQGGYLVPNSCRFGWAGGVRDVVLPEVYYPTCPAALRQPPANPPAPPRAGPKIARVTMSPATISAGQQSAFTIELDTPPPGAFVVGISHVTNTGVDDAVVNMPVSATFTAGVRSFRVTINTRRVPGVNVATDIVFTAFHFGDQKSAQLVINR
jgi:hypothetical protein